jgi:hypothetical protein
MCTAGKLFDGTCSDETNPVALAYKRGIGTDLMDCYPKYPSWDLIAVHAAVVGIEEAQMFAQPGTDIVSYLGEEVFDTT